MNENKLPREWVNTKLGNIVDYGRSAKEGANKFLI